MRQNITLLLELGWLCPALLSLLRSPTSSPQVHSDKNSQILIKMLNGSECRWWTANGTGSTSMALEGSDDGGGKFGALLGSKSTRKPIEFVKRQKTVVEQGEKKADQQKQEEDEGEEEGEDNGDELFLVWGMTSLFALVSLAGIVGNMLVVFVVLRVPGMITPTNCYLVSLAISDTIFLSAAGPVELSNLHVEGYMFGSIGCKLLTFLPYLGINTSSMSIMAFTIERFIGICHPLRARYICTVRRANLIILFIWCFCILYNSPWLYLATLKESECNFRLSRDNWTYKVVFVADFLAFYLVPMVLYIFIYGMITYRLSRSDLLKYSTVNNYPHRHSLCPASDLSSATLTTSTMAPDSPIKNGGTNAHVGGGSTSTGTHNNANGANGNTNQNNNNHNSGNNNSNNNNNNGANTMRRNSTTAKGKVQVIKMLAVVVFIFAVCWLPYRAMVMYNSFADDIGWGAWYSDWYINMSKAMIFFNCAINPVLYNLMSGRFRQAFLRLLNGEKRFISSYKRESICMQTAGGTHLRFMPPTTANGHRRKNCVLSRMAARDAEARTTLLLRVHQKEVGNGEFRSRVEEMAGTDSQQQKEEEEQKMGEEQR